MSIVAFLLLCVLLWLLSMSKAAVDCDQQQSTAINRDLGLQWRCDVNGRGDQWGSQTVICNRGSRRVKLLCQGNLATHLSSGKGLKMNLGDLAIREIL